MKKHLNKNRPILDAFQMMHVDKVIPKFSLSQSKKLMPTALMDSSVCVNVAAALVTGRQQHAHPF